MNRWVSFPSICLLKKNYVLTMCSVHVSRNTHATVHVLRWEDNFMGFISFSATWFSGAELRLPGLVSTPFIWGAILPSNFKYWLISKLENQVNSCSFAHSFIHSFNHVAVDGLELACIAYQVGLQFTDTHLPVSSSRMACVISLGSFMVLRLFLMIQVLLQSSLCIYTIFCPLLTQTSLKV